MMVTYKIKQNQSEIGLKLWIEEAESVDDEFKTLVVFSIYEIEEAESVDDEIENLVVACSIYEIEQQNWSMEKLVWIGIYKHSEIIDDQIGRRWWGKWLIAESKLEISIARKTLVRSINGQEKLEMSTQGKKGISTSSQIRGE